MQSQRVSDTYQFSSQNDTAILDSMRNVFHEINRGEAVAFDNTLSEHNGPKEESPKKQRMQRLLQTCTTKQLIELSGGKVKRDKSPLGASRKYVENELMGKQKKYDERLAILRYLQYEEEMAESKDVPDINPNSAKLVSDLGRADLGLTQKLYEEGALKKQKREKQFEEKVKQQKELEAQVMAELANNQVTESGRKMTLAEFQSYYNSRLSGASSKNKKDEARAQRDKMRHVKTLRDDQVYRDISDRGSLQLDYEHELSSKKNDKKRFLNKGIENRLLGSQVKSQRHQDDLMKKYTPSFTPKINKKSL